MNLSGFIAKRYFLSKRKKNFINILTIISVVIIAVCTASLVIVLSVFNGLEGLLRSLNSSFDPEIQISAAKGKSFVYTDSLQQVIGSVEGVSLITEVIEDYAYVKYKDSEMVVTMKGVSESFIEEMRIDESIVQGEPILESGAANYAIIGMGVQNILRAYLNDDFNAMQVHYIKDVRSGSLNTSQLYSKKSVQPSGVFSIQKYYDENYIFIPLRVAQELMEYGDKRTSIEVKTRSSVSVQEVKEALISVLGSAFVVLDNEEQHADLYKILKIEKLFVFISLVLIMGVGSINILFVLSMLAIEKKADIAILFSMGAKKTMIRHIFLKEGMFISFTGTAIGLALGSITCILQQEVGLVTMGMQTAVQNIYPVEMQIQDFVYTALSVITLTFLVSWRPASIAMKYSDLKHLPG